MKLISFHVERYRNILDSGEIEVDNRVTCLVGKNESGKSNVLHALLRLNPQPVHRDFDVDQYPRWRRKDDQRGSLYKSARPITATFELDETEIEAIHERFGNDVVKSNTWTLGMDYENNQEFDVPIDEVAACRNIDVRYQISAGQETLEDLAAELDRRSKATEADDAGGQVATSAARQATAAKRELDELYGDGSVEDAIGNFLIDRVPKFFYFDDYSQLEGRTEIEPLIVALRTGQVGTLSESQRTALALLNLGFANDDLLNPNYERRSSEMEAVGADLTRKVRKYWHQNDSLRLRVDIDPVEEHRADGSHIINRFLQLRVEDDRHNFTNSLDVRSAGFRWFISFLAAFEEFEADQSVIVLLDEPALSLHARAQRDFLDFIEETLAAHHQVLYTTHSPFMVDAGHLERVRVVEDMGPDEGTKVKSQLMSKDPDTLSPLQGALGYDIAQNIFVGPDNLVVEGLSDYTYLTVMSEVLRAAGRGHLDPRWRVLPAGGGGTMPAAVALLGRELDVTVLVDGGSNPPQKLVNLVSEGLLTSTRIVMVGPIAGLKSADIEDLFRIDDYLAIFNSALAESIQESSLGATGDRIVARIERVRGTFNHNDPSNWFLKNRDPATAALQSETLDRFEDLFDVLNATLSK